MASQQKNREDVSFDYHQYKQAKDNKEIADNFLDKVKEEIKDLNARKRKYQKSSSAYQKVIKSYDKQYPDFESYYNQEARKNSRNNQEVVSDQNQEE